MAASDAPSIPWRERLSAWWRGFDAAEYHAWRSGNAPEPAPRSMEDMIPAMPVLSSVDHVQARIDVLQRLFGPGFTGPGGPEHAVDMVRPFGLTPEHSVLDLSVGLGGPATAVVNRFSVWITGYEMDPELAGRAPQVVSALKGGDRVTIRGFTAGETTLKPHSVDCVISREAMFAVHDRQEILQSIRSALKPWGQIMITDYVLPTEEPPSDRIKSWLESEDLTYKPWAKSDYEKVFKGLGLDLRIMEDRSQEHHGHIRDTFARFVETLNGSDPLAEDPAHRAALIVEAERWARRASLLEAGELALYRFFLLLPEKKPEPT